MKTKNISIQHNIDKIDEINLEMNLKYISKSSEIELIERQEVEKYFSENKKNRDKYALFIWNEAQRMNNKKMKLIGIKVKLEYIQL